MLDALIVWLGSRFSPEDYLAWTRVQSVAWSAADVVIVFYLLRIANLARRRCGAVPHRVPYAVLAATLPLLPCLAVASTPRLIFALELLITLPHFLLILHVLAFNPRIFMRYLDLLTGQEK